ncbi:MAG: hypothetical protein RLZZ158_1452 [Cyanobacteriota bacterium]|jgi:hypothetical protein
MLLFAKRRCFDLWAGLLALVLLLIQPSLALAAFGGQAIGQGVGQGVETIEVAMRLDNIYGFSARDKTYNVAGTVWFEYSEFVQRQLEASSEDVLSLIEFYNRIDPQNARTFPLSAKVLKLADGRYLQGYQFSGQFYSDEINFYGSPFGSIPLSVDLQPRPGALEGLVRDVVLQVSAEGGEVGRRVGISGYEIIKWSFKNTEYQRQSRIANGQAAVRSRLIFEVIYKANAWAALVKWILPLAIVMLLMLLTPNLSSTLASDRLGIPPVVMLTVVFLQQAYRETLPTLPYLTFLDGLYAFSYVVTLSFFVLFIWAYNRMDAIEEQNRAALVRRIDRWDQRLQQFSLIGYGLLVILAWWRF